MVTYSDLVTLILVFFILLFSMSQVDMEKFEGISESFKNQIIFDFNSSTVSKGNLDDSGDIDSNNNQEDELEHPSEDENKNEKQHVMDEVRQFLNENDLNDSISTKKTKQGVALVLQESILFEIGKPDIVESRKSVFNKVGKLL